MNEGTKAIIAKNQEQDRAIASVKKSVEDVKQEKDREIASLKQKLEGVESELSSVKSENQELKDRLDRIEQLLKLNQ